MNINIDLLQWSINFWKNKFWGAVKNEIMSNKELTV